MVPVAVREVKVGQANAQNAPVVSQPKPVSYTHLDVYKRQGMPRVA